jgi:hypothetical protein
MTHLGLFEGIGGFSLAARWAGWHTVAWCEINPFCQTVLKYHFPNATAYEDIKETDFSVYRGRIDIITGGFPCQPYSTAGKRLGKEDERHLWPEMLRAIREVQPRWVVGENVSGLLNWKLKGTKSGRLYFQLQVSTLRTDATGSGLLLTPTILPTPRANQVNGCNLNSESLARRKKGNLEEVVAGWVTGLLPTPQAIDGNGNGRELRLKKDCNRNPNQPGSWRGDLKDFAAIGLLPTPISSPSMDQTVEGTRKLLASRDRKQGNLIESIVMMLPTPATRDYKGARSKEALEASGRNHTNSLPDAFAQTGISSQLNPQFVAEMMGFPTDWTELPFQNGEPKV